MKTWHIITCEYPPQTGGVSDYTQLLARELIKAGDQVHVWAPWCDADNKDGFVHRTLGQFDKDAFAKTESELRKPSSTISEVLVQWVPHGYGKRSMNVAFCRWIESLAKSGYRVSIMIHEPGLELNEGTWKQRLVARVHRRMIRILLRSAHRVFLSIPAWERYLRPYAPEQTRFEWLPIPATIPVVNSNPTQPAPKSIGHLGTYSAEIKQLLAPAIREILSRDSGCRFLLMGNHSQDLASELALQNSNFAPRIQATGKLSNEHLSRAISSCDLMLQPFPDGLSTRRTSLMNALAHGVAVICNLGHLSEDFWATSNAVALADIMQFADCCLHLLNNDSERKTIAHSGRSLYASRFDWPNVITTLRSSPESLPSGLSNHRSASYSG